ncbi:MAG: UDP-N-acetylmuramate--L-alanine ligase [Patescibacteria group bacterium]
MFLDHYNRIHCIGVGGIGISAIAKFLVVKGKMVSGSDSASSRIVDGVAKLGVETWIGSNAEKITKDIELIVYSEAVPEDDAERVRAKELGIKQLGHFDFLGELSKEYRTICVTGTNGKSTTTAMTGKIFEKAGLDPTVFVGTLVPGWELGNLRVGKGDILILEGDEYKRKMLKLHPETTLMTNIEEDHLDVYQDLADIESAFQQLGHQTKKTVFQNWFEQGRHIYCGDGTARLCFFGMELDAPLRFPYFRFGFKKAKRVIEHGAQRLGDLLIKLPGEFNMMNALAARQLAREYEIADAVSNASLAEFPGVWRRFERVGLYHGAEIISDYGHHPTAVAGTIFAAREFFPGRRVILCFQPHQHSRTKALFADFVKSFAGADLIVLPEIYHVEGRNEEEGKISSHDLLKVFSEKVSSVIPTFYAKDLGEAQAILEKEIKPDDVVLIMGAGNVDEIARRLVK